MPPSPRWSLSRRIAAGVAIAAAAVWMASALAVLWHASRDRAAPADAIVVLGAAQYRGRPSPVLRARLDHAMGLYARGMARWVVLTGGTAEGDTASEAVVSRAYLLQSGVPDSVLLLENEGRTTSQSLRRVAAMLRARDLEQVILVSDPFHVFRASLVARRHGLAVLTSPTNTDALARAFRQPGYFLGETVKAPLALAMEW